MEISSHLFSHMYTERFRVVRRFLSFNKSRGFLDCACGFLPVTGTLQRSLQPPQYNFNLLMNCYQVSASTCGDKSAQFSQAGT